MGKVIDHLRGVLGGRGPDGAAEADLLRRYVRRRDEAAFAALVRLHGPMVMGVCRRVLNNAHDAEDAFQAAFLVLVRKAASLRSPGLLGNWLYGVAYRTALEARAAAARRRAKEAKVVPLQTTPEDPWADLRPALDQELERLPEKYRAVVVLCDLEGKTRKEAAERLGWPEGTVASRLAGARVLLARRLTRRGLALSGGTLGALLAGNASAGVPDSLVTSTVEAATLLAAGRATAATVPAVALAEGVLRRMLLSKLKIVPAALAVVLLLGLGVGELTYRALGRGQTDPTASRRVPSPTRPAVGQAGATRQPGKEADSLEGAWALIEIEFEGRKITEEELKTVGIRWVIRGDTLTESARGKKRESVIRLDPSRRPMRLTLTVRDGTGGEFFPGGTEKGTVIPGIYRLDKDRLTVCFNGKGGKEAPEKFETGVDTPWGLYVLRRLPKDAGPPKKPTDDLPGELAVGKNKLQQLGIALADYVDAYGRLPPAAVYDKDGKALLSWRVLLLPHLAKPEYVNLYNQFKLDEPWDSPNNKKLLEKMPPFYASPSVPTKERYMTFYQVFVGKETPFGGREGRKEDDIKDLPSAVLIVEGAEAVPWTKPQDLPYDGGKVLPKVGGPFVTGFHALTGFTQVQFFPRKGFDEKSFRGDIERGPGR